MIKLLIAILLSATAFRLTIKFSNFFIPPRDHWRKSKWEILSVRFGMAIAVSAFVFAAIVGLI